MQTIDDSVSLLLPWFVDYREEDGEKDRCHGRYRLRTEIASVTALTSLHAGGRCMVDGRVAEDRGSTPIGYWRADCNAGLGEFVISFAPRIGVEALEKKEGEQR